MKGGFESFKVLKSTHYLGGNYTILRTFAIVGSSNTLKKF